MVKCKSSLLQNRNSAHQFSTHSGTVYKLEQNADINGMMASGFPKEMWQNFEKGIPSNWLQIIEDYNNGKYDLKPDKNIELKNPEPEKRKRGRPRKQPLVTSLETKVISEKIEKKSSPKASEDKKKSKGSCKEEEKIHLDIKSNLRNSIELETTKDLPATPKKEVKKISCPRSEPVKKKSLKMEKERRLSQPSELKPSVRKSFSGRNVVKPVLYWMNEKKEDYVQAAIMKRKWLE